MPEPKMEMVAAQNEKKTADVSSIRERLKGTDLYVCLCVICFGWSSWIDYHGVMVEMPILVHTQPEGWALPAYMTFIVQAAMVAPLLYALVNLFCPGKIKTREVLMAYMIMIIGIVCCVLLAVCWSYTAFVGGKLRSIAFLILVAALSLLDTTSCVVYLPFRRVFFYF